MSENEDFRKIYEYSDWVRNSDGTEIEAEENIVRLRSTDGLRPSLMAMEKMVRDIEFAKDSVGFELKQDWRGKPNAIPKSKLSECYFYALRAFLINHAFPVRLVYSPHVQVVNEALAALDLLPDKFAFGKPDSRNHNTGKTHAEVFNDVVAKIGAIVGSSQFRERLRVRKRNAERNEATGLAIEQKVFEGKSRCLVLMLHFGYQEKHRATITLEEIQAHRTRLFNNRRTNTLLRGIVDYIWKLEEGDESGLHLHVLIFYKADSCRDVYIAKQIGEYWKEMVTEGKGQYWNSNVNKRLHEKYGHGIGTGEINWNDEVKREALRKNICYMSKADQFLRMKHGVHIRVFGTSQPQKKKKAGRPRRQLRKSASHGELVAHASASDATRDDVKSYNRT